LRFPSVHGAVLSEERKSAMNVELNKLMVQRCVPLLEPKNMRFALAPGSKSIFLNPAERRLFFTFKGLIETDCTVEVMNMKLEAILPHLPTSVLKAVPICPIPGVFPAMTKSVSSECQSGQKSTKRRAQKTSALASSSEVFVTKPPGKRLRRSKAQDGTVASDLGLPHAFSSHSPMPLCGLLKNMPLFTPGGEPALWSACKQRSVLPPVGRECDFEVIIARISQRMTAWGITFSLKKGDLAWTNLEEILTLSGIVNPGVSASGHMLRWWIASMARYILSI
jgi:hypothetical protein